MIRHLIKLIWNKKRKNALLIIEIFLSFFIFFAISSFAIHKFDNYLSPLGFDYEKVWILNYDLGNGMSATERLETTERMRQYLAEAPEVKVTAYSGNALPFSQTSNSTYLKYKGVNAYTSYFRASSSYSEVLNLPLVEGRWFIEDDIASDFPPIVINQRLKNKISPDEPMAGKVVELDEIKRKVVGVIGEFKSRHEFQTPPSVTFFPLLDTTSLGNCILLKVTDDADVNFEEKMTKALTQIAPNWTFELEYLEQKRDVAGRIVTIPLIIMLIIAGFLIFNVALGLFGVLWYNINQRKSEIGLRRASGASAWSITKQFVGEMWVISTFGMLIGLFFAIQFPLLNVFDLQASIYFLAMLVSMLLIYLLTTICALLPSTQAAAIQPAIALHEE